MNMRAPALVLSVLAVVLAALVGTVFGESEPDGVSVSAGEPSQVGEGSDNSEPAASASTQPAPSATEASGGAGDDGSVANQNPSPATDQIPSPSSEEFPPASPAQVPTSTPSFGSADPQSAPTATGPDAPSPCDGRQKKDTAERELVSGSKRSGGFVLLADRDDAGIAVFLHADGSTAEALLPRVDAEACRQSWAMVFPDGGRPNGNVGDEGEDGSGVGLFWRVPSDATSLTDAQEQFDWIVEDIVEGQLEVEAEDWGNVIIFDAGGGSVGLELALTISEKACVGGVFFDNLATPGPFTPPSTSAVGNRLEGLLGTCPRTQAIVDDNLLGFQNLCDSKERPANLRCVPEVLSWLADPAG